MSYRPEARFDVACDVQAREFDDELVVLDLTRGEYFSLDDVGARIWKRLAAGESLAQVVCALEAEFDADAAHLEGDLLRFTQELVRKQLIVERR